MTRQKLVTVRLSASQHARLTAAAAAAATNSSALIRDLVFASLGAPGSAPAPLASRSSGALARTVSCRLTTAEAERLTEQARDCELPVAAYVRLVLRGGSPRPRRPDAHAAVVALSRVGNNLNQLTRLAHAGKLLSRDLFGAIEALRAEVYHVREEILAVSEGRP